MIVVAAIHRVRSADRTPPTARATVACNRVVSLAPSVTEILFALGLGDRVVGVTRFCDYPPEAAAKPRIGGYSDPSYELILRLRPDAVFMLNLHEKQQAFLSQLGIDTMALETGSVSNIFDSVRQIAGQCGVAPRGARLVASMEDRLVKIKGLIQGRTPPRVLVSVGRSMGSNAIGEIFAAGGNTFFNEVIQIAGGRNAVNSKTVMYPRLSAEGVIAIDPEVIIDLVNNLQDKAIAPGDVIDQWRVAAPTAAVRNGRVHVLGQDYVVIPGPRVILLVEQMARLLHPDVDWSLL